MADIPDKTFVCSVVFLDIVGYSKESVQQQMAWKRELNGYITTVITGLRDDERIILDTGDGAALSFLGDPEIALIVAIRLLDLFKGREKTEHDMLVRIGINLGAVKVIQDINGQPNLVGDGINVGQRVMSFAKPNQILASRSFFEVVSCLTSEYQKIFHHLGAQKDKHTREHDVYEICPRNQAGISERTPDTPIETAHVVAKSSAAQAGYCEVLLNAETLSALQALTKKYVGPIGAILVQRSMKSALNLKELCRVLSETVSNLNERAIFLKRAEEIVNAPQQIAALPKSQPLSETTDSATQRTKEIPQVTAWDTATLSTVEQILAEFVGPLAKVLTKRAASQSGTPKDLIAALSEQINIPAEKKQFQIQLQKKLGW